MDFDIVSSQEVSTLFREKKIGTFQEAALWIKHLPYRRNDRKHDLAIALKEGYGTCSTKHAVLKQLALEHERTEVRLMLCLFRMHAANAPAIEPTLLRYQLPYIPEAHNCLSVQGTIMDCTHTHSSEKDFAPDLISETEIIPQQVAGFKVTYLKNFYAQWLRQHPGFKYSTEELFAIREQCIADLQK